MACSHIFNIYQPGLILPQTMELLSIERRRAIGSESQELAVARLPANA
jgi:hypothetical protein